MLVGILQGFEQHHSKLWAMSYTRLKWMWQVWAIKQARDWQDSKYIIPIHHYPWVLKFPFSPSTMPSHKPNFHCGPFLIAWKIVFAGKGTKFLQYIVWQRRKQEYQNVWLNFGRTSQLNPYNSALGGCGRLFRVCTLSYSAVDDKEQQKKQAKR